MIASLVLDEQGFVVEVGNCAVEAAAGLQTCLETVQTDAESFALISPLLYRYVCFLFESVSESLHVYVDFH